MNVTPPKTIRRRRLRHLDLLVMLVVMVVVQSFLEGSTIFQRAVFNVLFLVLVLSAIRTLSRSLTRSAAAISLGVIAFAGSWVTEYVASTWILALVYATYIAVLVLLVVALGENVSSDGRPDLDRIIGAISVLPLCWE